MRHPEAGDHFSGQRGWTWILPRLQDPVFIDSDEEQEDLVEVSEKTSKFLHLKCTWSVTNETRKKVRTWYPLPKVPATRPPQLDTFLKQEVSMNTKNADKELAALMLDSLLTC